MGLKAARVTEGEASLSEATGTSSSELAASEFEVAESGRLGTLRYTHLRDGGSKSCDERSEPKSLLSPRYFSMEPSYTTRVRAHSRESSKVSMEQ